MPHSFNKLWVHVVFSTKNRDQIILPEIENELYSYFETELKELQCPVSIVNGMPDHIHLLFLQNPNLGLASIVKQLKGSTSHFVNRERLVPFQFAWQVGYAAFSVSQSQLDKAYHYIKNQKQHHLTKSFEQEYNEFVEYYTK
jgi:putative transposase